MSRKNKKSLLLFLSPESKKLFHVWCLQHDTTMQATLEDHIASLAATPEEKAGAELRTKPR